MVLHIIELEPIEFLQLNNKYFVECVTSMLCPLFFWNLGVGVAVCVRVGATSCQLIFCKFCIQRGIGTWALTMIHCVLFYLDIQYLRRKGIYVEIGFYLPFMGEGIKIFITGPIIKWSSLLPVTLHLIVLVGYSFLELCAIRCMN